MPPSGQSFTIYLRNPRDNTPPLLSKTHLFKSQIYKCKFHLKSGFTDTLKANYTSMGYLQLNRKVLFSISFNQLSNKEGIH